MFLFITMSKYSCIIFFVISPGLPVPIFFESIEITGVISAAVPVRKISSDMINSLLLKSLSITSISKSLPILRIASLVIPSNAEDDSDGVINWLSLTMNMFSPGASLTFPFGDLFDKNGITAAIVSWRKFSDNSTPTQAKMGGNYLNSIIATQEAKRNGIDEAILLDHNGNVSEAPGENIFIVKDGQLITPSLSSSALEGITRDAILKIGKDLDIDVVERNFTRSELIISDEIFLTGTAAEITPVISMDSKKIGNGKPGDITKKMMQEYSDIVMNKNIDYAHWLTKVY